MAVVDRTLDQRVLDRRTLPHWLRSVVVHGAYLIACLIFVLPFIWAISGSLKGPYEVQQFPPQLIPNPIRWQNYEQIWQIVPLGQFLVNTLIITTLSLIGKIASAALVAYGFARFRFPGRDRLFLLVLSSLMLPVHVTLIPTFVMFYKLGWIDTFLPLIVPSYFGGGAFAIFLMRQFFRTLPLDLDEAAKIDGASYPQIFFWILLPLVRTGLLALAVLSFLGSWEEFLGPLIYLQSTEKLTVAVGLLFLSTQAGVELPGVPTTQLLMGASIVATIPPILLYIVVQRQLVQGIALTGIKG